MNNNKRIALTIDDLPYVSLSPDGKSKEGVEITNLLLQHLKQNDVTVTGFVIGGKTGEEEKRLDLVGKWHSDGHLLANHTYSHPSLSKISSGDFEKEVIRNEEILAPYWGENTGKYFRFPYLDYGNTIEQRSRALDFLHKRSYTIVPVTLDSKDYVHNRIYSDARLNDDAEMMQQAIDRYLEYTREVVEFHERQAIHFFGRQIGHIMLIHANRINAHSLGSIITLLKCKGYEFVLLTEVLNESGFRQKCAKIYHPQYMSWQEQSGDGKFNWINYPDVNPERLEAYNKKMQD